MHVAFLNWLTWSFDLVTNLTYMQNHVFSYESCECIWKELQMLKLTPMQWDACSRTAKDWLADAWPCFNEVFFQISHVTDWSLVNCLLRQTPNLIVHWIKVGAVWRPEIRSSEFQHLHLQQLNGVASMVGGSTILLEHESRSGTSVHDWQCVVSAAHFDNNSHWLDSWFNKDQLQTPKFQHGHGNHQWLRDLNDIGADIWQ